MRRTAAAFLGAAVLVAGLGTPAMGATDTVPGEGPIKRMKVINGEQKLTVKIFSDSGKNEVRWVAANIKRKSDGKAYRISGMWIQDQFVRSLEWNGNLKACDGLVVKYNNEDNYWRLAAPRSCLPKLTPRVKVDGELASTIDARPGLAGPTRWIPQG